VRLEPFNWLLTMSLVGQEQPLAERSLRAVVGAGTHKQNFRAEGRKGCDF